MGDGLSLPGFYGIPTAILLVTFVVEALLRGRRSREAALASGQL